MNIKRFVLSYYEKATKDFYITKLTKPVEALKLHSHNYFQVYYILKGRIVHHIHSSEAILSHGDMFVLPPDVPHYIDVLDSEVCFYSMSFMPDFTGSDSKLVSDFLRFLESSDTQKLHLKITLPEEDIPFTESIFHRIMKEFDGNEAGKAELIRGCVTVLLSLFARLCFEDQADSLSFEANKQSVIYCMEYIKKHPDEDITLTEIAHRSAMSKTCFCSIFSSVAGTSFKNYLNMQRIELASQLLSQGEKISAVCTRCGYSDFSTFYRNFKKHMKMSPREYITKGRLSN